MIQVASYCRVSTDKEDQANSFAAQQRYFSQYICRHPQWELYRIYADEGITGTSTKKRAQFQRMIRDAQAGKFHIILTKEVSRFSRNLLDTIAYTRQLKAMGVSVIFLTDGINTMDPDAELRLSIMASIAQEESRRTSARVKWGQTRQMERGVVFGRSMLGYDVNGGVLSVNPEGARVVQRIFHLYGVEKLGTTQIARLLEGEGIRTFSGNPHWSSSHLVKILKNEKYVGDLVQKKTYTPDYLSHTKRPNHGEEPLVTLTGHHPPIISRPLWERVQEELRLRSKHTQGSRSVHHALSGKIQCGVCGSVFVARQRKSSIGHLTLYWSCASSAHGNSCSVGQLLRDDDARQMVHQALSALGLDPRTLADSLLSLIGSFHGQGQLERERQSLFQRKAVLLDAFAAGRITGEELARMKENYDRRLVHLEQQSRKREDVTHNREEVEAGIVHTLEGPAVPDPLCRLLVERVTVYPDRRLTLQMCHLPMVFRFRDGRQHSEPLPGKAKCPILEIPTPEKEGKVMDTPILQQLLDLQDPAYRQFQCKLMPTVDPNVVIGVRMPQLRRLAKQLRGTTQAERFLAQLPHTYYEESNLHGLLVCECKGYEETIEALDRFLPYVDNWATCDLLSPKVFRKHPQPLPHQAWTWMQSPHTYTIRFGIGVLLRFYLDDCFAPEYLEWAAAVHSEEYYVRMMVAWYFAEALVKQPDAALTYLLQRRLSPWVHNKTIQKATESFRITPEQKQYLRSLRIR